MNSYSIIKQTRDKIEALVHECLSKCPEEEREELLTLMKISRLGAGDYFLRCFFNAWEQYSICIDEAVKNVLESNNDECGCFGDAKATQSKLEEYLKDKIPEDNDYFKNLPPRLKDTIRRYYHNTPEFLGMKKKIRASVKEAFSGALTETIKNWYIDHNEWY